MKSIFFRYLKYDFKKYLSAIILSAGIGRRIRYTKALLKLNEKFLIQNIIFSKKNSLVKNSVIVLGENSRSIIKKSIFLNYYYVINYNFFIGISSSITLGFIKKNKNSDSAVLVHVDQPLINHYLINKLIRFYPKYANNKILIPIHNSIKGHPLIIGSLYKKKIIQLHGDIGPKSILKINKKITISINFFGIIFDVDNKKVYEIALRKIRNKKIVLQIIL